MSKPKQCGQTPFDYPLLKQHLGWKLAPCQHPMYILVDEDRGEPIIGERVPPWGAATGEEYLERVQRNMNSMEAFTQLKINYEWAAIALDEIAEKHPQVAAQMRERLRAGSMEFVGGELSLAHLHTYSSESCWRQFEYGSEIYERLFGTRVRVHAHQETQLFEQLPQVLRHFGYEYIVVPCFPWAMRILEGPFELLGQENEAYLKQGDEFIEALALDGTAIPAYVPTHVRSTSAADEISKDLFRRPPLWIDFPDLEEVNEEDVRKWSSLYDMVLLSDALAERMRIAPPRAKGRLHTYWAYVEGVWAEEHLRMSKAAEEAAVLAGNLLAMARIAGLSLDRQKEIRHLWRKILKYQDHEVTWTEVTDLRRKGISNFEEATDQARQLASDVALSLVQEDAGSVAVFNGLPRSRPVLLEVSADQVPGGGPPFQRFGNRYLGCRRIPAGGFTSFRVQKENWKPSAETELPQAAATPHYRVEVSSEGLMRQITTAEGRDLLKPGAYLGGEIRAVVGDQWVSNRAADCRWYEGDVCSILERRGSLGHIPLAERYFFLKQLPAIKVELEFDFDADEVGYFWVEESKVNVYYPTTGSDVYHDVPFGCVRARENEHLYATNWLYCGGLVYVNRGTIRHWVRDGLIANTLAWGGSKFTNRMHYQWWMERSGPYDLRLYGQHRIEYFLIPFGRFSETRVVGDVEALVAPTLVTPGRGRRSFCQVRDRSLAITGLYENESSVWARGYQLPRKKKTRFREWQIFNVPLEEIARVPVRGRVNSSS